MSLSRLINMVNNSFSADNINIVSIQLNLFDFYDGPEDFDMLLNQKITRYMDLNLENNKTYGFKLENNLVLISFNHFNFNTRLCSKCDKLSLIKNNLF